MSAGCFTPDGKEVVTVGGEGDASLRVWSPKTGECSVTLQRHPFHEERECARHAIRLDLGFYFGHMAPSRTRICGRTDFCFHSKFILEVSGRSR